MGETKGGLMKACVKSAENRAETKGGRGVDLCKVNCGYVNASLPHIGGTKERGLRLMGLVCVCVCMREGMGEGVLDGSRWAQSQECHRCKPNKSTASPGENARYASNHSSSSSRHCYSKMCSNPPSYTHSHSALVRNRTPSITVKKA